MTNDHSMHSDKPPEKKSWWFTFPGFIALIFLIASGYYLITEHRAHLFNMLPLLILLLCPLMHLFHRHGGHHKQDDNNSSEKKD